jgi:hypothetical protein
MGSIKIFPFYHSDVKKILDLGAKCAKHSDVRECGLRITYDIMFVNQQIKHSKYLNL